MKHTRERTEPATTDEVQRVAQEISNRLRALGIALTGRETPEELANIEEAVERFEVAVEAKGGDLMVDEPPPSHPAEPDDRHFALPLRNDGERVADYLERLASATDVVRQHPARQE